MRAVHAPPAGTGAPADSPRRFTIPRCLSGQQCPAGSRSGGRRGQDQWGWHTRHWLDSPVHPAALQRADPEAYPGTHQERGRLPRCGAHFPTSAERGAAPPHPHRGDRAGIPDLRGVCELAKPPWCSTMLDAQLPCEQPRQLPRARRHTHPDLPRRGNTQGRQAPPERQERPHVHPSHQKRLPPQPLRGWHQRRPRRGAAPAPRTHPAAAPGAPAGSGGLGHARNRR
jgi:hypothetical protein